MLAGGADSAAVRYWLNDQHRKIIAEFVVLRR